MGEKRGDARTEPCVILGDIVFTREEVKVVRDGRTVRAVPRGEVASVEIETGTAAENPRRTRWWGYGCIWVSVATVLVPWMKADDVYAEGRLSTVVLLALGLLFILSSRPRTLVHLDGSRRVTLRSPRALGPNEVAALGEQLRDWFGYKVSS